MEQGRPTKYKPEYDEQAYKLTLLGMVDKELAKFFEVTEQTINAWKSEYPSFFESVKEGKDIANANVVKSLYKRALGYEHEEEKVFNYQGDIVTYTTTKRYPPEVAAIQLFLKNRDPKRWAASQKEDDDTIKVERTIED